MNVYYLISFVAYFAFFLGLSLYFYRRTTTASSFMLGNRSMNYWVTALSTQASDMSDWLFMAYPGLIYACGLFNLWVALGLVLFMFLNWQFIAPKLRSSTEQYNSLTLASFFERRFNDTSHILRSLAVFFVLFFITFYIGAELIGLGRLFETTFQMNYTLGIAISMALVIINILLGGFVALAWSDMFRGLFLLVMIVIVPIVALSQSEGVSSALSNLYQTSLTQALFPDFSWHTLSQIFLLSMGWGLGYFGSPYILLNFMGIKDVESMHKAKYVGITWQVIVLAAATIVGLVGRVFFTSPLPNRELVYVEMVKNLFSPLFAGFILCAVLAATMSVMTAQILTTASIISEDFFKRVCHVKTYEGCSLLILRSCIILLPILSYAVSYALSGNCINDIIAYAWSGLGLSFAPCVIAALYVPFANKYGAVAAMLLGGCLGMFWPAFGFGFMPLLPGFVICFALLLIVSWLTQRKTA